MLCFDSVFGFSVFGVDVGVGVGVGGSWFSARVRVCADQRKKIDFRKRKVSGREKSNPLKIFPKLWPIRRWLAARVSSLDEFFVFFDEAAKQVLASDELTFNDYRITATTLA